MRGLLLLLVLLLPFAVDARPPGNFGFGRPPAFPSLMRGLNIELRKYSKVATEISIPIAGCYSRGGFGRRDVCGYRFCVRVEGGLRADEVWVTQGFGFQAGAPGLCNHPFDAWKGDPPVAVADFCSFQPKQEGCEAGRTEGHAQLSVYESTGADELAEAAKEEAAAEKRQADELEAKMAAARAARAAREAELAEIKSRGPVDAYPALAIDRYKYCQEFANTFLSVDARKVIGRELQDTGMTLIKDCAAKAEVDLTEDVRAALAKAPARIAEPIKQLHAYTVASLRALANFHQSAIEARQERSERMSGIDERATRLELDIN